MIEKENILELKSVYHPLLVNGLGKKNVVPLTISFFKNKRGHLISGPNAGGKTIAMKTVGLSVLLACKGIFPLGEVITPMLDVYSSIGDGQSVEQNLSTFSAQLVRLRDILNVADNNSLLLIDEICSGTDPKEGSALALGMLDTFIELNLFFIVTTHQSSLKNYIINYRKNNIIQNDSFEFDDKELKPTFVFQEGMPGNSFAFFLAKTIGFSLLLLKRAKKYLSRKHQQSEKVIISLQKHKKEYEKLILECRSEQIKLNNEREQYEQKKKELTTKKEKIIAEAKLEADKIIKSASTLVDNTIKELKEAKRKEAEIKKEFKTEKERISKEVTRIRTEQVIKEKNFTIVENLSINDIVGMIDSNVDGIVLEANNIEKIALVIFNGLKFRLPYSQLYLKENKKEIKTTRIVPLNLSVETKLDLRGCRVEEALGLVEKFISQALYGNAIYASIIHGKGTGVLRDVIHNYLKSVTEVKSFRLGEQYEGGSGATFISFV